MGDGQFNEATYRDSSATRAATGRRDFEYTETATRVHPDLDPKRILTKPLGRLESRDSIEHPNSNPILICFDVTGSNRRRAVEAQQRLPSLMALVTRYVEDPQISVAANDDYFAGHPQGATQISEFESDNRIDDAIRQLWLVGDGGGNGSESYDLLLYAAARKTIHDSFEVRGKKGMMFLYADEPFPSRVDRRAVRDVFGDHLDRDIPIADMIAEARRTWEIFIIFPDGGYLNAREQYVQLFGERYVLDLQHPNLICELVASTVGRREASVTPEQAVTDLTSTGVDPAAANDMVGRIWREFGA